MAAITAAVVLVAALVTMVVISHAAEADKQRRAAAAAGAGPDRAQPMKMAAKATRKKKGKRAAKKLKTPNIVMVMTDDQAPSTINPTVMPNLFSRVVPRATSFTDYISSSPLCCPARAGYMTGQYGHNNGVLRNFYPDLIGKQNVLPSWMRNAGYTTAHVGKFLNSYEQGRLGPAAVAPGWDYWFTQMEPRRYYRWRASKNGQIRRFGVRDGDHLTTVTNDFASRWASRLAKKRAPFYMQVDYYAPHTAGGRDTRCRSGSVPEAEDEGRFADAEVPRPPNFNQPDVSKMPDHIRSRPPLSSEDIENMTRRYRCALESAYGIDRGIGKILDAIEDRGELDQTVVIFTTDNGFFFGEHRIPKGKPHPYEENLHIPMYLRVPAKYRDRAPLLPETNAPAVNIDLAPTILELAKADPCRTRRHCRRMDGRSLMPVIDGSGDFPSSRAIEVRLGACDYRGVRMDRKIYLAFFKETGLGCEQVDAEMYDLDADPHQVNNLLPAETAAASELRERMVAKMDRLGNCSGIKGRDERPDVGRFCE